MRFLADDLQWVIDSANSASFFMNFYFEERFDQDMDELREEMGIVLCKKSRGRRKK